MVVVQQLKLCDGCRKAAYYVYQEWQYLETCASLSSGVRTTPFGERWTLWRAEGAEHVTQDASWIGRLNSICRVSFFQASRCTATVVVAIVAERRQRAVEQCNQKHAAESTSQVRHVVHV